MTKFGVSRNGWELGLSWCYLQTFGHMERHYLILSQRKLSSKYKIQGCVLGEKILFWLDIYVGDNFLATLFPNLFSCA